MMYETVCYYRLVECESFASRESEKDSKALLQLLNSHVKLLKL